MKHLNPALIQVKEIKIVKPSRSFRQRLATSVYSAASTGQESFPYGKLRTLRAGK